MRFVGERDPPIVRAVILRLRRGLATAILLPGLAGPGAARAADHGPVPSTSAGAFMPPGDATLLLCRGPDGTVEIRTGSRTGPACEALLLPVPQEAIRWAGWIPGAADPERVALEGAGIGAAFAARWAAPASPEGPPRRSPALALGRSLLPGLAARPFGVEERVSIQRRDDEVTVTCRPGGRPAGLVLDPGALRLPEGARLQVRWSATGDVGFEGGLAPRNGAPREAASIGSVPHAYPVPADAALAAAPWFVVLCPGAGGSLTVSDLRLVPEAAAPSGGRSAWAWRPALWRDGAAGLIERARSLGLDRLFVAVEVDDGEVKDPERLARFVAAARQAGIAVAAVEGDPAMALDAGRAEALRRLEAIEAYQRRAPAEGRLAGLQYDIEPYLLPAWRADPAGVMRGWAATVEALRAAARTPLDMVLPFWLRDQPEAGAALLPALRRTADAVTVMAYRTDSAAVQAAAEPLLAWGTDARIPVRVALEMGPLEDEATRLYGRAEAGEVWLLPRAGGAAAVLLDRPRPNPGGPSYAFEREAPAPARRVSFLGDRARMLAVAEDAAEAFRAWPAFAGLAYHGLIE